MKVGIIGTRGIPASYSGFETSVQETAIRFTKHGIKTIVFCRYNHYEKKLSDYEGVKLKYLPSVKTKHFDTFTHSFFSTFISIFSKFDVVIVYGVGNAIFIPLLRFFSIPVIAVLDGADWEREKWSAFAKSFLKISRSLAVYLSSAYVVDSEVLLKEYNKIYSKKAIYIPYGANKAVKYDDNVLLKYQLEKKKYIIFVGRFVEEKRIDFLIENFVKIGSEIKLVIVGDNDLNKAYCEKLKSLADHRVIFTGFLYGNDYESLLHYSLFYVSCSSVEGTSPSLLSAMAINGFAFVTDIKENIETLKGSCETFKEGDGSDFQNKLINLLNNKDYIENSRIKTEQVVDKYYSWEEISLKYIAILNNVIKH